MKIFKNYYQKYAFINEILCIIAQDSKNRRMFFSYNNIFALKILFYRVCRENLLDFVLFSYIINIMVFREKIEHLYEFHNFVESIRGTAKIFYVQ